MKFFACNIGFIANMIANNERYTYEYEDFKTTLTIFLQKIQGAELYLRGKNKHTGVVDTLLAKYI